ALRDGAQQHRYASPSAGVYAFSRIDRSRKHEYVVALNNSERPASAAVPVFVPDSKWEKVWGSGSRELRTGGDEELDVSVAPLSAVVYRAKKHIPRSKRAPEPTLTVMRSADRTGVVADIPHDSFYEVTFLAKTGNGAWTDIGTDDNAPYRVFQDTSDIAPGTQVSYKAIVLDNAGHTRTSATTTVTIPPPRITIESPFENQGVRSSVSLRATVAPEHPNYAMTFQRSTNGGATWTTVGTDDSSPVYNATDNPSALPDGTLVRYRAVLDYGTGTTTSDVRTVKVVQTRVTTTKVHYNRPGGGYDAWGLHIFGDGLASGEDTPVWEQPAPFEGSDTFGAFHEIDIADDEKPVGIIVHGRPPLTDPGVKDTDPNRYYIPLATPEIWLRQGDGRIFNCPAANDGCVVPSAG
ncbi:MAG TPA: pullulanase-associated domain-containing protein, partial [Solirubrobacteraceae bacterium]|nr:pullulanase-associated domain-containing protein [Solirubrobacteraceae bacterium]